MDYVEDTAADADKQSHFRPVEDLVELDGKKHYQQDISAQAVDLATKLSYRDAASAGDGISSKPSPDTIRRRVNTHGKKPS
jgi:transposase-like protein